MAKDGIPFVELLHLASAPTDGEGETWPPRPFDAVVEEVELLASQLISLRPSMIESMLFSVALLREGQKGSALEERLTTTAIGDVVC